MGKCKEETRIEKIIRGLLKLPENRRCINCRSLGPQYVCTTFWTFVCTNCSGVHREFNHRVKSVSMAKFSSEEVNALQAAGNEQARQTYFKTWDAERNFHPDNRFQTLPLLPEKSEHNQIDFRRKQHILFALEGFFFLFVLSNIHKLRDFIKHVYVDRRYTGETHPVLIPRLRSIEEEELYEHRSGDPSGKPWIHERNLDRYGQFSFKEVRSSGYGRENSPRYDGFGSNSPRFEVSEYQVDGARIAGRSATDMFTTEDIRPKANSPSCGSPRVHHVREILGENFARSRVGDQPSPTLRRNFYASANNAKVGFHPRACNRNVDGHSRGQEGHTQKSGDPSRNVHRRSASAFSQSVVQPSKQTSEKNVEMKPKSESVASFFANFPSPEECIEEDTHVENKENSASSQPSQVKEASHNAPPKNALEFLLFELSSPGPTPLNNNSEVLAIEKPKESPSPQQPKQHSVVPVLDVASPSTEQPQQHPVVPVLDVVTPNTQQPKQHSTITTLECVTPSTQQHSIVSVLDDSTAALQTSCSNGVTDNQTRALSTAQSVAVSTPEKNPAGNVQPSTTEARSTGRAELPAELFSSFNPRGPLPGWQIGPSHGTGFNLQPPPASMQTPAFPARTKSRNPFDTDDSTTQYYLTNTMFPSPTSAQPQGGLPNMSTSSETSRVGFESKGSVPVQSSSSYPSGAYVGQNVYSNMPAARQQAIGRYGGQEGNPGSFNSNQQTHSTQLTNPNMRSFPNNGGGNPFG